MFKHANHVAIWSVIGGFVNTAVCARCLFVHEYLVALWAAFLVMAMVAQFYIASVDAAEAAAVTPATVAWYRGDDLRCWSCSSYAENAGQLSACPKCGATEKS